MSPLWKHPAKASLPSAPLLKGDGQPDVRVPAPRAGQFILCLFVFVSALSFPQACLASIFYYIGVVIRQDLHVGSYLNAGAKTAGCVIVGSTIAGIVVCATCAFPNCACLVGHKQQVFGIRTARVHA